MKIIFKKDLDKKYTCTICSKQFNWNEDSSWFGQIDKPDESQGEFCSEKCASVFLTTHQIKK